MAQPAAGKKILFIDDDEDLKWALARLLQGAGYQVRCAANGDEGLLLASQERPDLILLDYIMPVKDGFTMCQELGQLPGMADVPIIVMTAFGQNIGEIYGLPRQRACLCIAEFLEKPVEANVLLDRIAHVLTKG